MSKPMKLHNGIGVPKPVESVSIDNSGRINFNLTEGGQSCVVYLGIQYNLKECRTDAIRILWKYWDAPDKIIDGLEGLLGERISDFQREYLTSYLEAFRSNFSETVL